MSPSFVFSKKDVAAHIVQYILSGHDKAVIKDGWSLAITLLKCS
jgi:hypothetical protein